MCRCFLFHVLPGSWYYIFLLPFPFPGSKFTAASVPQVVSMTVDAASGLFLCVHLLEMLYGVSNSPSFGAGQIRCFPVQAFYLVAAKGEDRVSGVVVVSTLCSAWRLSTRDRRKGNSVGYLRRRL